ncbi:hypothetical protein PAEAM_59760 [Paenibacillus sp. GM1FR]|nr:hypothetical protein PAEAM_59760 [Paenibacillus sp. GM1FR]
MWSQTSFAIVRCTEVRYHFLKSQSIIEVNKQYDYRSGGAFSLLGTGEYTRYYAHILVKTTGIKAIIIITDITFLLVRDLIISFREVYQSPKL